MDVSFISLKHIFPVAQAVTADQATGVCLVKPQFEEAEKRLAKKGVVREPETHKEVILQAAGYGAVNGFSGAGGLDYSPIKGPEGKNEFPLFVEKAKDEPVLLQEELADQVVSAAQRSVIVISP